MYREEMIIEVRKKNKVRGRVFKGIGINERKEKFRKWTMFRIKRRME